MPLPRTLCRFLLQAAAIAAYRGAASLCAGHAQ